MFEDDKYRSADDDRHVEGPRPYLDTVDRYDNRPRGWWLVSWLVILGLAGTIVYLRDVKAEKQPLPAPLDDTAATTLGISEMQIRLAIGFAELMRQHEPDPKKAEDEVRNLYETQLQPASTHGTFGQRLQYAIAAGELVGPKSALEALGKLKWDWQQSNLQPAAEQLVIFDVLRRIYSDYRDKKFDAPSVKDAERETLLARLGWYGRLALTPRDAPDKVARKVVIDRALRIGYVMIAFAAGIILLGLIGCVALLGFAVAILAGGLKVGLRPGSASSGVYAETFALWMFLFMGGLIIVELWPRQQDRFLLNLVVMFGSLLVLIWPVLRGIPWHQVRADLGLTWGRLGILEPFCGLPAYILMLPLLGIGFAITMLLIVVAAGAGAGGGGAPQGPFEPHQFLSHPAVEVMMRGDFWLRLQLAVLACVAAPVVEEIMFRGVLYRQLRDGTSGLGWLPSCIISGLWISFIFAVIHPQGLLAVPALMGIACGCTLAREWRDSLWASIVVHAMNNTLVFTLVMLCVS